MTDKKITNNEKLNEKELDSVSGGYYEQDVENIEMRRKEAEEMERKKREAELKKEREKATMGLAKFIVRSYTKYHK